jgi:hypothetical protein
MNKQQLKQCFDRIKPSEQLVAETIQRVHALERKKTMPVRRAAPNFAFATRLGTAACALLLVVGIGIGIGTPGGLLNTARDTDTPTPMNVHGEPSDVSSDQTPGAINREAMIARAAEQGTDWAVLEAVIDMAAGDGSIVLTVSEIVKVARQDGATDWSVDTPMTLQAYFNADNEQLQTLFDAVGDRVLVGMHAEQRDGSMIWVLHEFHPVEEIQQ